ncbi:LOW QUALITY PROTEIN: hypothetical protein HID58_095443 [Brassica napus]|uniref:Exonuclease domain-containing protein n=1 Tax=Brassica napus TaxID=3708 RepID=A0ABQ7X3M2_BRANA|nr:LOW QUALITY PROTEIN: hypothetical protein HID58_095443 [Brassica napus]
MENKRTKQNRTAFSHPRVWCDHRMSKNTRGGRELHNAYTTQRPFGGLVKIGWITRDKVADAPSFEDVAEKIYGLLNGRIWAGHNIRRFDCVRIKEAFAEIGKAAPEPSGIIDSLGLLSDKFGKRAGNMKMASLAAYFGLGVQKHRSLDDVRMNLEVLKHCATVLFLESTLSNQLEGKWQSSSKIMTRSRSSYQTAQRAMPYSKGSLGKMTQNVKNLLSKAQGNQALQSLIKHSHSLLR